MIIALGIALAIVAFAASIWFIAFVAWKGRSGPGDEF